MKQRHILNLILLALICTLSSVYTGSASAGVDYPLPAIAKGDISPFNEKVKRTEPTKAQKVKVKNTYGKLPLYFIKNDGQVDGQVSFYERGAGHATFFTKDGVVLSLTKRDDKSEKPSFKKDILGLETEKSAKATTEAVSLSFVGTNKKAKISASEKMSGKVNYFVGNDKSGWRSNIPTYGTVTYEDVYRNIDVKFYGNNKNIEHDVIVRPGGDFSQVKFAYQGIKGLKITEAGDLEVTLNHGKIIEQKPFIYQEIKGERVAVAGAYKVFEEKDGAFTYGFRVASYDHTRNLVIDPVLDYSTYLGGSLGDTGYGIAVDNTGAAYVTGTTRSTDFPLASPIQGTFGGGVLDVFITKINPVGSALVYSTYLGGSFDENSNAIAVDSAGSAYVTGDTWSMDFPLMNPIQGTYAGGAAPGGDAFVTKINPAGSVLVYSTYLGGSVADIGNDIAVDSAGAAYVTGETWSTDFPLMNPVQGLLRGTGDAFVTKINPAGSAIVYSTYLGGSVEDAGRGIAVDSAGAAYVTGSALSTDFPLLNPAQVAFGGTEDAFITKINPLGTAYAYSTFLGGFLYEEGYAIAVDSTGAAYVTGYTTSTDFPTVNAVQSTHGGGNWDVFVTKINSFGSAFVYSTYLGGSNQEFGNGIALDSTGAAYVTGKTWSNNFPLMNPIQGVNAGLWDVFITKLTPQGSPYVYSTYLGGSTMDLGYGIAVDSAGSAYVTGVTASSNFPLMNPIQGGLGGLGDIFISKITDTPPNPPVPDIKANGSDGPITITRATTLNLRVALNPGAFNGTNADWWVLAVTPTGLYHYDLPRNSWLPGQVVTYQGPIFNLTPFTVFNGSRLPVGVYTLTFEVDTTMNGVKDTPIYSDNVVVTVR